MSPAWMCPIPPHLGRGTVLEISVMAVPCLDELHEGTAAGIYAEATEKLYERHYLVIKIVSSFFACLIKFLYL